jgi:hypothetical protein
MKILKVIVDEVPKSCFWCDLCTQSSDVGSMLVTYNCNIVGKSVDAWESDGKRPDWCPLVAELTDDEYFYKYRKEFIESEE